MAGDWIKFDTSTPDKPEVFEMAAELGIDPDAVVGKLLRVWKWFDQQTTDGNAPLTVRALVDRYAGVTGFCAAMENCGWMLSEGNTLTIPNFDRHNGQTAKNRALTAKRVARHVAKTNGGTNAATVSPSVSPSLPEKRREEKNREEGERDSAPSPEKALDDELESLEPFRKDPHRIPRGATAIDRWETIANHVDAEYADQMADNRDNMLRSVQKFALYFEENGWTSRNWKMRLRRWLLDDLRPSGRKSA